jgi:hypothetical protein
MQGKTQFLFFVFRLLQAMGEYVIFLDKSILPLKRTLKSDTMERCFYEYKWCSQR